MTEHVTAVITAGGKGTRVASVNSTLPKPLLPLLGKPVLVRQIECLARQGIRDLVLTIGHLGYKIKDCIGDGKSFGVRVDYVEETSPLGTAGALWYLRDRLKEDFFLINGDIVFDVDLRRMMSFHRERRAEATLFVHRNDHPYDSGIVLCGPDGKVTGWLSKEDPRTCCANRVNAGIHALSPAFLNRLKGPVKTDLDRDLLKPMIGGGGLYAYCSPEYVKDMGTPGRIAEVERDLEAGLPARKCLDRRQRCVFLDRDGTINAYKGFVRDPADLELLPGAAEAIRRLNRAGFLVIVVTNQPVIARGEVSWERLKAIHDKLETLLGEKGAYVDDIRVCPHHPDRGFAGERPEYKIDCDCRKPKPGLLLSAAADYNIDLGASFMVGDSPRDTAAGDAAGCRRSFLLGEGFDLRRAVDVILKTDPVA